MADHHFPRDKTQTRKGGRYDATHQRARAAAARKHKPTDLCARCGEELGPMGPYLHYDHDEHGGYLGFSHAECNLHAGAVKGNQRQREARDGVEYRRWVL